MNTTATIIARPSARITRNLPVPPCARIADPSAGRVEITLAKIRIDIPLPIPRWVISSPIHMIRAVPAVSVSTISAIRGAVSVAVNRSSLAPVLGSSRLKRNTSPVDCSNASTIVT